MIGHRSTDIQDWDGRWRIPGTDNWYVGTLYFDPTGGFKLELLDGAFEPYCKEVLGPENEISSSTIVTGITGNLESDLTIWGEAKGKKITLFGFYCEHKATNFGGSIGYTYSTYVGDRGLVGAHVESETEPIVEGAFWSVDYLHYLLDGPDDLAVEIKTDELNNSSMWTLTIEVDPNKTLRGSYELGDGTRVSISHDKVLPSLSWSAYSFSSYGEEVLLLKHEMKQLKTIEDSAEMGLMLSKMVSLIIGQECGVNGLALKLNIGGYSVDCDFLTTRPAPPADRQATRKPLGESFRFHGAEFFPVWSRWLEFVEDKHRLVGLLAELSFNKKLPLEAHVFLAATLAEAFHKAVFGTGADSCLSNSVELFNELFPSAKVDVSDQAKPFFKLRALDLFMRLPGPIRTKLMSEPVTWVNYLAKMRNTIVHEALLDDSEFEVALAVSSMTMAIVHLLLWSELGVEVGKLQSALERGRTFRDLLWRSRNLCDK